MGAVACPIGKAYFDDVGPLGNIAQGELMAGGNGFPQRHAQADLALAQRLDGHGDIVARGDFDPLAHLATTSSIAARAPLVKIASREAVTDASKPASSALRSLPQKSKHAI